jgi:hypothetical protein
MCPLCRDGITVLCIIPEHDCRRMYAVLSSECRIRRLRAGMETDPSLRPIVVYVVRQHPLERDSSRPPFRWLHTDNDFRRSLEKLIGPFDDAQMSMIVDDLPAGPGWDTLLGALGEEKVRMVVTHLAPLTSAQRQQLIGVCAQTGASLVTPSDAGRNRQGNSKPFNQ